MLTFAIKQLRFLQVQDSDLKETLTFACPHNVSDLQRLLIARKEQRNHNNITRSSELKRNDIPARRWGTVEALREGLGGGCWGLGSCNFYKLNCNLWLRDPLPRILEIDACIDYYVAFVYS